MELGRMSELVVLTPNEQQLLRDNTNVVSDVALTGRALNCVGPVGSVHRACLSVPHFFTLDGRKFRAYCGQCWKESGGDRLIHPKYEDMEAVYPEITSVVQFVREHPGLNSMELVEIGLIQNGPQLISRAKELGLVCYNNGGWWVKE